MVLRILLTGGARTSTFGYRCRSWPGVPRIRFAHQVLILQIGVVVLVAVTGYGLAAWVAARTSSATSTAGGR